MEEIWKDIRGYEGIYQVSNFGRIKALPKYVDWLRGKRFVPEKILSPFLNNKGYLMIKLTKSKVKHNEFIHRLVAKMFLPNNENKEVVNHKDYNPKNNNVKNLEWCTQKENVNYSIQHYKKRKSITYSNTGEKYISYRLSKKVYRILIDKKEYSGGKTLEEAIRRRDRILNETI